MHWAGDRPQDFGCLSKLRKQGEWKGPLVGWKEEGKEVSKTESPLFCHREEGTGFTPADGSSASSGFVLGNEHE